MQPRALSLESLRARPSPLAVETISDFDAFIELEPVWRHLCARAGLDHPFAGHGWIRSWWEAFGGDRRLHVLLVSGEDGEPLGIAPLMRGRIRVFGIPLRSIESIGNVHTPRFDLIVASRHAEVRRAVLDRLLAERSTWDVLLLRDLPADSETLPGVAEPARAHGLRTGVWTSTASPRIEIGGAWEVFIGSLSSRRRSNLRNRQRRLERLGAVALEEVRDAEAVAPAMADALRLEALGWKGSAGTAIASQPDTTRFYTTLAERAAREGSLRLYFLTLGGERIAFHLCLLHAGIVYLLKMGFDPRLSTCAPATVLFGRLLEEAHRFGAAAVDMLGDSEPWKLAWTQTTLPHFWLFAFGDRRRARVAHALKFRLLPALRRHAAFRVARDWLLGDRRRAVPLEKD